MIEKYLECINADKKMIRTGWMQRGVPPAIGESVAEHSYEAALIGLFIAEKLKKENNRIKPEKVAVLLLVHDYIECVVGDIPYYSVKKIGRDQKEKIETKAMIEVVGKNSILKKHFNEWLRKRSVESKIAELSDKLATLIEARRLINAGYAEVNDIYENVKKELTTMLSHKEYSFAKKVVNELVSAIDKKD